MYIRTVQSKLKDGSTARYVQLAHNHRNKLTGKVKLEILYSFGREDDVDLQELSRLADSIERFLKRSTS